MSVSASFPRFGKGLSTPLLDESLCRRPVVKFTDRTQSFTRMTSLGWKSLVGGPVLARGLAPGPPGPHSMSGPVGDPLYIYAHTFGSKSQRSS